jgi:hypothetical protein
MRTTTLLPALLIAASCTADVLDVEPSEAELTRSPFGLCNASSLMGDFAQRWGSDSCERIALGTDRTRWECLPDEGDSPRLVFEAAVTRRVWNTPTQLSFDEWRAKDLGSREPIYRFAYGSCDCGRAPVSPGVDYCMFETLVVR